MKTIFVLIASFGVVACAEESSSAGIARTGSTARFAIAGSHLYSVAGPELRVFDLSVADLPAEVGGTYVGLDIETLFAAGPSLYVGADTGLYIVDIAEPAAPRVIGSFVHARACDPVVVEGNYAYVTLRSTGSCPGTTNELDVFDVTDPTAPIQVAAYPLNGPSGLGIEGGRLFVCDGTDGLKVFDATDPLALQLTEHVRFTTCDDVIPNGGILIATSSAGIEQYDYTGETLELLSRL
jgi:hypothetical protein